MTAINDLIYSKDNDDKWEFSSGRPLVRHFAGKYRDAYGINSDHFVPQMIEDIENMLKEHADALSQQHEREIVGARLRHELVLFGAELGYCLANNFPIGEGHKPPSMIYEAMESKVDKYLESRYPELGEQQSNGGET